MARQQKGAGSAATTDRGSGSGSGDIDVMSMKVTELRQELKDRGVTGTSGMRKEELVKQLKKSLGGAQGSRSGGSAKKTMPSGQQGTGGVRTGKHTSKSIKYAQEVTSTEDEPEREGRSLVTTDHDVIMQWAEERGAEPATVGDGEPRVLRFDFAGGDSDLTRIEWEDWLRVFEDRGLNFIYQETRSDGRQSNFFRLENPNREDA